MAERERTHETRGAVPSGVDTPSPRKSKYVDEDTNLRIRPGEHTPDPGESNPVRVPEEQWEAHNQRKDTAQGLATEDEPVE